MDLALFRNYQFLFILTQYLCTSVSPQYIFPGRQFKPESCKSYSGAPGICVPLRQCGYLVLSLFQHPVNGRQAIHDSFCHPQRYDGVVCCPLIKKTNKAQGGNSNGPNKRPANPTSKPSQSQTVRPTSKQPIKSSTSKPSQSQTLRPTPNKPIISSTVKPTTPEPNQPILQSDDDEDVNAYSFTAFGTENTTECGYSAEALDKIVGGVPSTPGAWPWMVNLGYLQRNNSYDYLCGGSLISSRHVVTAAHCVYDKDALEIVRLGEYDLTSDKDGAHPIDVRIQKKIIHPRFNPRQLENDIAILKLDKEVKFTDEIHPICLPSANDFRTEDIEGTNPFVAGWGLTQFQGSASAVLRETQVPVVDTATCRKSYEQKNMMIDDRVICAGDTVLGQDSCQGDSGGPLMAPKNLTFYLIGVVSSGYKCAEPGFPGIYTRVTSFLDFIASNMK
ncbi:hypothetical protein QAD02_004221 [Eretmocerus hayati]|uniref:Uncharacterized protein n=1 Tax=Eretmocerus hayati TaxID=131215 RepID=A0ACC2NTU5_9HYME|nr:hypothetical protein QAD02_004221 [Eretmocerus hayati]